MGQFISGWPGQKTLRGHSQDFSKGGGGTEATHQIVMLTSTPCMFQTRAIDENTSKKKFLKSGLFNNGFYGQDIVMVFSPPEYCRLFYSKEGLPRGDHRHPRTPPSYAPALKARRINILNSRNYILLKVTKKESITGH